MKPFILFFFCVLVCPMLVFGQSSGLFETRYDGKGDQFDPNCNNSTCKTTGTISPDNKFAKLGISTGTPSVCWGSFSIQFPIYRDKVFFTSGSEYFFLSLGTETEQLKCFQSSYNVFFRLKPYYILNGEAIDSVKYENQLNFLEVVKTKSGKYEVIISGNVYWGFDESRLYEKEPLHTVNVTLEDPKWKDLQNIVNVCASIGEQIDLKNYFTTGIENTPLKGFSFYLNGSAIPIAFDILKTSDLNFGANTVSVKKTYDNGEYTSDITINRQGVPITIGDYPDVVCQGSGTFYIPGGPSGGNWSGSGITPHGDFTPTISGSNTLTYKYTDPNGCLTEEKIVVFVLLTPSKPLVNGTTNGCDNQKIILEASATGGLNLEYLWYKEGETTPFFTGNLLSHIIRGDERFYVVAKSQNGCLSEKSETIAVQSFTPQGEISTTKTEIEQGESLRFRFTPPHGVDKKDYTYLWSFGDGFTAVKDEPLHYFNKAGAFGISLIVTSKEGCKKEILFSDSIKVAPTKPIPPKPLPPQPEIEYPPIATKFYPNPFRNWMKITHHSGYEETAKVEIFNKTGRPLYENTIEFKKGDNEFLLDDLWKIELNGVYYMSIKSPHFSMFEPIIKVNQDIWKKY